MRGHPVRILSAWLLSAGALAAQAPPAPPAPPPAAAVGPPPGASAQVGAAEPRIRLELAGEQVLRAGAHAVVSVLVQLPAGNDAPLLLTPSIEGQTVELVRGRLSRSDARRVDATRLRFEIPLRARSEGTAILRIELMTYICERRCKRVILSGHQVLRVQG